MQRSGREIPRGRSGTASKSLTVLAYSAPKVSKLTVGRCDEDGTANGKSGWEILREYLEGQGLTAAGSHGGVISYENDWHSCVVFDVYSVEGNEW